MKRFLAIAMALVMVFAVAACSTPATDDTTTPAPAGSAAPADSAAPVDSSEPTGTERAPIAAADLKIGVILVHDDNSGYDAAHLQGIKGAMAALGIAESQAVFKYNIPEDETCYDTAVDLAEQGCQIIFSDSYGHQSHMMAAAAEYPNVIFVADTGDTAALEPVTNVANIFPYTFESRYVSGVVAGMKLKELMDAGTVADPYIGYVGAYPYAEVVSGYTAFFLGIQSIVPTAHMDVQYTNSWYDPVAEGEAANALMSKGCVIIGQHADSTGAPSAVQAAQDAGKVVYSVGYNIDMLSVAPKAALTSAQNNWVALYTPILNCMLTGEKVPVDLALGYTDDAVMISALGESCAAGTAEKVAEVEAALKDGTLQVFDTSKFTVGGATVTTYAWQDTDGDFVGDSGEAIENGVFVESVFRSAPYFALRIDGITELN
ncbi:MAG TPA: BMP family ABC transporter substrate-binding protein [Clostridia bacterium]|nr:BMP family ABC transporter substrate-binding protein [Clostridia bacterium]